MTIEPNSSNLSGDAPGGTSAEAAASLPPSPVFTAASEVPEVEDEIEEEPEVDLPFAEPLEFIDESPQSPHDAGITAEAFAYHMRGNARGLGIRDGTGRRQPGARAGTARGRPGALAGRGHE